MSKLFRNATFMVLAATLAATVSHFALAAKPGGGGGGGGGTDGGTIYFNGRGLGFAMMNPDGSGKTPLPVTGGEPSRLLHAGHRWFLEGHAIAGDSYPNGVQRQELFADRDDGAFSVQLTSDPELQYFGEPRWEPGDPAVSWLARRWDFATGQVVDAGIYDAELVFDADGNVAGLAQQPLLPLVTAGLVADSNGFLMPDMRGYDWSPDGTEVVSDRDSGKELWITDLLTGTSSLLVQTDWATVPVWSPDGSKIAFNAYQGIGTISPSGANLKTIISGGPTYNYGGPIWSPTGTHLTFYRWDHWTKTGFTVYRSTADGKNKTSLTNELDSAYPLGWR